jgi:hypothetical protein
MLNFKQKSKYIGYSRTLWWFAKQEGIQYKYASEIRSRSKKGIFPERNIRGNSEFQMGITEYFNVSSLIRRPQMYVPCCFVTRNYLVKNLLRLQMHCFTKLLNGKHNTLVKNFPWEISQKFINFYSLRRFIFYQTTVGYARTNVVGSRTSFVLASLRSSLHWYIQGNSGGICNTLGNDSMCYSKQKSSYEHGSDFERLPR